MISDSQRLPPELWSMILKFKSREEMLHHIKPNGKHDIWINIEEQAIEDTSQGEHRIDGANIIVAAKCLHLNKNQNKIIFIDYGYYYLRGYSNSKSSLLLYGKMHRYIGFARFHFSHGCSS